MSWDSYTAECSCGHQLPVELFEAGTQKICPKCFIAVRVPDTVRLKKSAGDPYPLLSARQKLLWTLESGESPFDGTCHDCRRANAVFETACRLEVMEQRVVDEDQNRIYPNLTGGLTLKKAAAEEQWFTWDIPLHLCKNCQRQFRTDRRYHRIIAFTKQIGLFGLLGGFIALIWTDIELVVGLAAVFGLAGAIAWMVRIRLSSESGCPVTARYIRKIRWAAELLDNEDEYRLAAHATVRIKDAQ